MDGVMLTVTLSLSRTLVRHTFGCIFEGFSREG